MWWTVVIVEFKYVIIMALKDLFHNPRYISLDSNDQVYVTDYKVNEGISVFIEDDHFIKKINCNEPWAICLTPDDYIITTKGDCSSLTVFSPTHQLIT